MNQRNYNKLYVSKTREEGSYSLLLGYKHDEKAISLQKDKETFFHIPSFSQPIKLADSDLIINGALGGPFPAASDRIFKNQQNYGDYTPNGNVTNPPPDGMWFCSWLYYDPVSQTNQWMDRFYNPGMFVYNQAVADLQLEPSYISNKTVFVDKPSTMVFEEGVLYKYFHLGEQTYQNLVTTLGGISGERLLLNLSNWTDLNTIDSSLNNFLVRFSSNQIRELSRSSSETNSTPTRLLPSTVDFDNNITTNVSIDYDAAYNPTNEFSWSFWAHSNNWQNNSFAQLVGNYSSKGEGISFSVEDGTSTPIIVIPETHYGHLLLLNEKGEGYLDKTVQDDLTLVSPSVFALDSENNIIVCNVGQFGTIYKMDHVGEIIATTKNFAEEETLFSFFSGDEDALQMVCGENDDIHILTKRALYTFNKQLKLVTMIPITNSNTIMAFSYSSKNNSVKLELVNEVYDAKYIENDRWSLRLDGHLYKNGSLYQKFDDVATKIAVSPDEKLWILHGNNKLSIVDTTITDVYANKIINTFFVGVETNRTSTSPRLKNLSFINQFDRNTNTRQWLAVVYYSDEKTVYYYNLQGVLVNFVFINGLFNSYIVGQRNQSYEKFKFEGVGDFTGYEHRRVFKNTNPFNNKSQLVLRTGLRDFSKPYRSYTLNKYAFSINDWEKESWHHFLLTYQNRRLMLYVDGHKKLDQTLADHLRFTYDNQPSLHIGASLGSKESFNTEVQYTSNMFNGKIGAVQIYDYAIKEDVLPFFLKATVVEQSLQWYYPTPSTQYVEEIEKMYKHKLPGAKSSYYNLKLIGTNIKDSMTQSIVESEIRELIDQIAPTYTDLLQINWIDE